MIYICICLMLASHVWPRGIEITRHHLYQVYRYGWSVCVCVCGVGMGMGDRGWARRAGRNNTCITIHGINNCLPIKLLSDKMSLKIF